MELKKELDKFISVSTHMIQKVKFVIDEDVDDYYINIFKHILGTKKGIDNDLIQQVTLNDISSLQQYYLIVALYVYIFNSYYYLVEQEDINDTSMQKHNEILKSWITFGTRLLLKIVYKNTDDNDIKNNSEDDIDLSSSFFKTIPIKLDNVDSFGVIFGINKKTVDKIREIVKEDQHQPYMYYIEEYYHYSNKISKSNYTQHHPLNKILVELLVSEFFPKDDLMFSQDTLFNYYLNYINSLKITTHEKLNTFEMSLPDYIEEVFETYNKTIGKCIYNGLVLYARPKPFYEDSFLYGISNWEFSTRHFELILTSSFDYALKTSYYYKHPLVLYYNKNEIVKNNKFKIVQELEFRDVTNKIGNQKKYNDYDYVIYREKIEECGELYFITNYNLDKKLTTPESECYDIFEIYKFKYLEYIYAPTLKTVLGID
ncbi:DhNV_057 [Dikerogammarus haemobaphes nudivirus]|nr:DhNV_057 [Dikerogammarus haemobaphes nudivirus]